MQEGEGPEVVGGAGFEPTTVVGHYPIDEREREREREGEWERLGGE
jgi:hypothetical protein